MAPNLETLPVIMAISGGVLLYSAVTNRHPADVVKLGLQNKDLSMARPISNTTPGGLFTDVVPGTPSGSPGEFHSNGTVRMWPNGSPRYSNDPDVPDSDPRRRYNPDRSTWRQAPRDATRAQGGSEPYAAPGWVAGGVSYVPTPVSGNRAV